VCGIAGGCFNDIRSSIYYHEGDAYAPEGGDSGYT
jgi:hypothetical protein